MKLVVLLFPSIDKLFRFRLAAEPIVFETNIAKKSILCRCNEDQMELASYVYGAIGMEVQASLN